VGLTPHIWLISKVVKNNRFGRVLLLLDDPEFAFFNSQESRIVG
jgi:hypothetical protein